MDNFKISKITPREKSSRIKVYLFIVAILFAAAGVYYFNSRTPSVVNQNYKTNDASTTTGNGSLANKVQAPSPPPVAATSTPKQSNVLNLPIPFTPQAPTGNWDQLHNEACEEASAIMANAYLTGDKDVIMPPSQVETEINNLTVWQDQHFGYNLDTTAQETAQMIEGVYGLQTKVLNDYTLQDIKDQINLHHVVILPVNGQVIGNPNYKQPGPIYHMLVVRGYTSTGLITNDSGTRRGENYPYTFETLHSAGADWDHNTNTIDQNKKVMIVVWK